MDHHWKRAGKVIHRYDDWRPGRWKPTWKLVPTFEDRTGRNGGDGNVQAIDIAGDYLFLARNCASRKLDVHRGHVDVHRLDTAEHVGWMEPPARWTGPIGIIDITVGMRAFRRGNGEYVVFLEDDGMSKTVVYRWTVR